MRLAGEGPTNDDEAFFVPVDLGSLSSEGGPLMMIKDSSFLLISNVLGRGCGASREPTNDGEGISVSAFRCCRNGT